MLKMKKILITGAKGFLGRNYAHFFKELGYETFGIGHGDLSVKECNHIGLDYWIKGDVLLQSLIDLKQQFDIIIHCAGSGSVGFSVEHPYEDFRKTVNGSLEVLEYIRVYNPNAIMIYPSSPAVQGEHDDLPIKEEFIGKPVSPYGYHKKIVENLCESYAFKYGLNIKILRLFSVYGVGLTKQLLWDACQKFLNGEGTIVFWGNGQETRDFIHVDDVCFLTLKVLSSKPGFMIFNGGSGNKMTIFEIVMKIQQQLGHDRKIVFNQKINEGNPKFYWADLAKVSMMDWRATIDFDDGLKKYLAWVVEK